MRPTRLTSLSLENLFTGIIGAWPKSPPHSMVSPTCFPITGIIRTAVVFWFIMPIADSSAICPK